MGENIGAHRKFPQYLLVKQETSALCHVQKGRPSRESETNVSLANRVKQDSQFHNVDTGDIIWKWKFLYRARILRSGSLLTQANKKAVSLSYQIQMHPRSKPSRETLRS